MVNLENHKGSFCIHTTKFCQEGYCSRCEIYLKKSAQNNLVDRCVGAKLQEIANSR